MWDGNNIFLKYGNKSHNGQDIIITLEMCDEKSLHVEMENDNKDSINSRLLFM